MAGAGQDNFAVGEQRCASGTFNIPFRYFICPLITALFNGIDFIYSNIIIRVLPFSPLNDAAVEGSAEAALFDIWNNFRVLANILLVVVFLLAIIGQGLAGFEVFSAYEIKKIVPRLVVGVIMVQLSWYFVGFMVDVFNILGAGIRGIILAPVDGIQFTLNLDLEGNWNEIASTIGIIGGVGVGLWVGGVVMGLPLILFPIIFGLILAFLTILLRRVLLMLLIITSPVAMLAWILPTTDVVFKKWWEYFWKALIVYPLIIALLAAGELFAKIIIAGNTADAASATQQNIYLSITAIIMLFAPYFLIPMVFRFAGGAMALIAGGLDNQGKNLNKRLFGDQTHGWRAGRREKQVTGRTARKNRLMGRADTMKKTGKLGRISGGRLFKGAGAALYAAGSLTGKTMTDTSSELYKQANGRMLQIYNLGNHDHPFGVLSDKHLSEGSTVIGPDGEPVFVGNDLDPDAINSGKKDRINPYNVQAALNVALLDARGDEEKVRNIYDGFFNGTDYGRGLTKYERGQMVERAADFNNSLSADYLYRDPDKGWALSSDKDTQLRFARRINARLGDERSLSSQTGSFWGGATELMSSAGKIYDTNKANNGGTFNASNLGETDKKILQETYMMHQGLVVGAFPSYFQGTEEANRARTNFVGRGSDPKSRRHDFISGDRQAQKDLQGLTR